MRAPGEVEFGQLTDPYRPELLAHCYRMLGSVHDAEDLVQETYLRAWRAFDQFEGRSSIRTWLYRIATTTCLRALENRQRRPLPSGIHQPSAHSGDPVEPPPEHPWLQPLPDLLSQGTTSADPATVFAAQENIRLALIAALQHLNPRSRAVLILRDVLRWRAAEVAVLLETTTAAVNSTLQRARAHLRELDPDQEQMVEPSDPAVQDLLRRYAEAFERADIPGLTRLLRDDATLEMPPTPTWFRGGSTIAEFLAPRLEEAAGWRMVPIRANGQPGFAMYETTTERGLEQAHGIQVLTVGRSAVARIVLFMDPELFPVFGLANRRQVVSR
jgi:RNA polymerase sigma-70 factor, ECF subfamily